MRDRRSYPTGPFRYLIDPQFHPAISASTLGLSRLQSLVLTRLRQGARLFLDVHDKRALLYDFQRGLRVLAELTVRCVAGLVRQGYLKITEIDGKRVHYQLV